MSDLFLYFYSIVVAYVFDKFAESSYILYSDLLAARTILTVDLKRTTYLRIFAHFSSFKNPCNFIQLQLFIHHSANLSAINAPLAVHASFFSYFRRCNDCVADSSLAYF